MVAHPAGRLATYEDLLALPEGVRAELVGGQLVMAPSPSPAHQGSVAALQGELYGPFQRGRGGPGGWWFIPDVDVRFGPNDVYRPDISGWRREHVPEFPTRRPVPQTPDWVCEALSPGTAELDQGEKRATYQRAGVPWYWLLDPSNRTITVLRLTEDGYVVERAAGDTGTARLPPFEQIELDLVAIFLAKIPD